MTPSDVAPALPGKTLLARALASSCSNSTTKICKPSSHLYSPISSLTPLSFQPSSCGKAQMSLASGSVRRKDSSASCSRRPRTLSRVSSSSMRLTVGDFPCYLTTPGAETSPLPSGLAPVRSAKQDQIHASLVSTLLALMDGMDGRGKHRIPGNTSTVANTALHRPSHRDWSHEQTGLGRSCTATSRSIRSRILLPTSQQGRS